MNRLGLRLRVRYPVVGVPRRRVGRRRAFRAVLWFALAFVVLNFGFAAYLDLGPPRLRDPEYGKRLAALKARLREHPSRPLVLVIGSSRTAMGVRPSVWEEADGDPGRPMLFNMSLAGSGPLMQLMLVRRTLADGICPDLVLIEYWPAFLREDGQYWEQSRIDVGRLRPVDLRLVREFFDDPEQTERQMFRRRLLPWHEHRFSLMNQFAASWLPFHRRFDAMSAELDGWGWLPGREPPTPEQRAHGIAAAAGYYAPLFAQFQITPVADRALRQAVAECRQAGVPVGLVYLPEATDFRALIPPAAAELAEGHLTNLREELALRIIDARDWSPDTDFPDGFHLTRPGAATFTRKLGPAVLTAFPELTQPPAPRR